MSRQVYSVVYANIQMQVKKGLIDGVAALLNDDF